MPPFDEKPFLASAPENPGVYRMFDAGGELLYVGKAKNLKRRLASYFAKQSANVRIQTLVSKIAAIEVTLTHTEAEALLLESNLIKQHRPRYNIVLRDDKSYPYIHIDTQANYPRLSFYRGSRARPGRFFGPYPSASAVRFTLNQLQKVFRVRLCEDSYFSNRSRPCLQHQIQRCSAPCVGLISPQAYQADIDDSIAFLEGKSEELVNARLERMEAAARQLEFERAAEYRDQIELLRRISQQQYINGAQGDVDVLACVSEASVACVQVFFIRAGSHLGNRSFFPRLPDGEVSASEVLEAFVGQYYSVREIPSEIILDGAIDAAAAMQAMLEQRKGSRVQLKSAVRGERARWVEMAVRNARTALKAHLSSKANLQERFESLQEALQLDALPTRLECFDISHTQGEATVASCVVFNQDGPLSADYRRFNITGITPGDDYAAMHQALMRRYKRVQQGEFPLPDILFIDGGKGQLQQGHEVLEELGVQGVTLVGIAKGEDRKAGLETLFIDGQEAPLILPAHTLALHLIQHIRDEAHRFAITGHRQRRDKRRASSSLEDIPGLGPKRRQQLLRHFGGLRGIARASIEELTKVQGISLQLAEQIYAAHHPDG
ncbi:MAG: excinuclease ABC subunit UvrC [Thiotrichales bacterium]